MLELSKINSLIICKSVHQENTREIAEALNEELKTDIKEPEDVSADDLEDKNIICIGSGIFIRKFHSSITEMLNSLPSTNKKVFLFSTSGLSHVPLLNNFKSKMTKKLRKKGFNIVGKFNCRGYENYGPFKYLGGINKGRPNKKDKEKAKKKLKKAIEGF